MKSVLSQALLGQAFVFGIDECSVYTDLISKLFLHLDFILAETIVLGNPRWLPESVNIENYEQL